MIFSLLVICMNIGGDDSYYPVVVLSSKSVSDHSAFAIVIMCLEFALLQYLVSNVLKRGQSDLKCSIFAAAFCTCIQNFVHSKLSLAGNCSFFIPFTKGIQIEHIPFTTVYASMV